MLFQNADKTRIGLSVLFGNAGLATRILHHFASAPVSSHPVRIEAEQPRPQLLTGYVIGLPSRVMSMPFGGALESRRVFLDAAPHVHWRDGKDAILSPDTCIVVDYRSVSSHNMFVNYFSCVNV